MTPVALVALVAFMLSEPYSHLAGAISLDFGGKQGNAAASGITDGTDTSGAFWPGTV